MFGWLKKFKIVWRSTMERELEYMRNLCQHKIKQNSDEVKKERKLLRVEISRLSRIRWNSSDGGVYCMTLVMEPQMFSGRAPQESLKYIARDFGYMAEA